MRERPFLWNNKHPSYKDHKRRESEFQAFSKEIGHPVQEIKRVWHVLRTNFFRAHKILLERKDITANGGGGTPDISGEKLWKYYLAMFYVLEGTNLNSSTSSSSNNTNNNINNNNSNNISTTSNTSTANNVNTNSTNSKKVNYYHNNTNNNNTSNNCSSSNCNDSICVPGSNIDDSTSSSRDIRQTRSSKILKEDMSIDIDDDHLYARSLTSTLKRFDPTTKEVIKLKFQEIIVHHMQKQQKELQQQQQLLHAEHTRVKK